MWLETTRVRQSRNLGPVTVAAERRGLLIRWLTARRRFESCLVLHLLRADALRRTAPVLGAKPDALRSLGEEGRTRLYPNRQRECVESAFSGRSSRPRRTNSSWLRYASGEAARLSIGREGFDLPTERQSTAVCRSRDRYFSFLDLRLMSAPCARL